MFALRLDYFSFSPLYRGFEDGVHAGRIFILNFNSLIKLKNTVMKSTIEKSIVLNATKEKVWDVLILDKFNTQWYAVFCEGTQAKTDWKQGSSVVFTDQTGDGMLARIVVNKPSEELDIKYEGFITGGKEDVTSEEVKPWVGLHERYKLSEEKNATRLDVKTEVPDKHLTSFNELWDKAVIKIKELSEA
jgi:hypothetical protein